MTAGKIIICIMAGLVAYAVASEPEKRVNRPCRCDCYWQGKEDGRNEVRKADAERRAARARGDELPEFMNREGWSTNMPDVN